MSLINTFVFVQIIDRVHYLSTCQPGILLYTCRVLFGGICGINSCAHSGVRWRLGHNMICITHLAA